MRLSDRRRPSAGQASPGQNPGATRLAGGRRIRSVNFPKIFVTQSNHTDYSPASYLVTGSRLGGCALVAVMRTGPHLGGGPGVKTGPDPAGRPPWAHFGHRQRPRGCLITTWGARWARFAGNPSGILRSPGVTRNPAWSFSVGSCSVRKDDNSTGGDRLRLQWLIQGKRAEDGGHNLVNTVTANLISAKVKRTNLALAA